MATLWERSDSSTWGTKCVLTPESSYKQSNSEAPNNLTVSGRLKGIIAKRVPPQMEFLFSQNAPCELTLPGAHFGRGMILQFGEGSVF